MIQSYTGDLGVLRRLARGESSPLLFAGPGGMRGASAGAITSELEQRNLTRHIRVGVGSSTGALAVAYPLAEQAVLGTSIYPQECTTPEFISYRRALLGKPLMGLDYIHSVFEYSGRAALNQQAAFAAPAEFWVVVTEAESGRIELHDAKAAWPSMMHAIRATIAVPAFSHPILVNGKYYYDGGVANPFPARSIVERFKPDDLLILANRPQGYQEGGGWLRRQLDAYGVRHTSPAFQAAHARRGDVYEEELNWLMHQLQCRYLILWSDPRLHSLTRDPQLIRQVIADTREGVSNLIEQSLA